MSLYLKVKNNSALVRDKNSSAVLSVDDVGLAKYKNERDRMMKLHTVYEENLRLKTEIEEIKTLLKSLLGQ
jgi:hypothetical protein